jgi:translation initiation factor 2-alpha kinase 4
MYSLGIIFFEMCMPFTTGMERNAVLSELRKPSIVFPSTWPPDMAAQEEIIRSLLQHDPTMRPKAKQLLVSPLLPSPERQQEYYDTAITGT